MAAGPGRTLPLVAFLLAAVVTGLSACSTSRPSAATATTGGAAHGRTTTTTAPLTKAQATQVADAINLRPADLPGYQTSPPDNGDGGNDAATDQLDSCANGAPQSATVADVSSDGFSQGTSLPEVQIESEVEAEQSAADAQTDLATIKTSTARQCIVTFFQEELGTAVGNGATISDVAMTPTASSAPGADGSFGDVLSATMKVDGVSVGIDIAFDGFVDHNYEVELTAFGIGESPPASTDQHLFGLLLSRARSAVH